MERDIFIITVFCLVSEQMNILRKSYKIRHCGFAPALSDEEVIIIEICDDNFKHSTDKDLFNYFKAHYQEWFPNLKTALYLLVKRLICGSSTPWFRNKSRARHNNFRLPCKWLTPFPFRFANGLGNQRQMFQNLCRLWLLWLERTALLQFQTRFALFENRDDNFCRALARTSAQR